jgi:hypothetical protein
VFVGLTGRQKVSQVPLCRGVLAKRVGFVFVIHEVKGQG